MLECRLREQLPAKYAELDAATQAAYERLSAAARCTLGALSPPAAPQRRKARGSRTAAASATATAPRLDELMEAACLRCFDRGCSTLSLIRYDAGAGATEHTDMGLLTMIDARDPGLELRTPFGWQSLVCQRGLVVLAGATLEAATGGAVRAALHRVVPQDTPRCLVVLRVRGSPGALLPVAPGGTIAAFEARFRATHGSINAPPRGPAIVVVDLETGEEGLVLAAHASQQARRAASIAEEVLAVPALAALIVEALAGVDESGVALARAEMVCCALRDSVAPVWARRCAELHRREQLELPAALSPAGHATQWKRLYRHSSVPRLNVKVQDLVDETEIHFKVTSRVCLNKVFDAYSTKKSLSRNAHRFLYDGASIADWKTPLCLELEDGDTINAVVEQMGD